MLRNDYRRALIMLRPHVRGMTGHVRLERRTLAGSMRFTVQSAPPGVLHAILMAHYGGRWLVYRLGALRNDARGQSGMTASFDPRNLLGLDLDKYTLVAIVLTGAGEPQLVMTGMVNGYKDVNWAQVITAATSQFAAKTPSERAAKKQADARDEAGKAQPARAETDGRDAAAESERVAAREAQADEGEVTAEQADGQGAEDAQSDVKPDEQSEVCCCEQMEAGSEGAEKSKADEGEVVEEQADGQGAADVQADEQPAVQPDVNPGEQSQECRRELMEAGSESEVMAEQADGQGAADIKADVQSKNTAQPQPSSAASKAEAGEISASEEFQPDARKGDGIDTASRQKSTAIFEVYAIAPEARDIEAAGLSDSSPSREAEQRESGEDA
ncbi:MAG: hypothetical protein Q4D04_14610, partial [Clostridia bacterium]|nr:hypothetical protein [Clostridia bacterium]